MYGELIPVGGGDPIPLLKKTLLVGRRESCDIVLRFANVSAHHCQLTLTGGYWYVKDLGSSNGTRVNNVHVSETEKVLKSGDNLRVAKHQYEVRYSPADLGAVGPPPTDDNGDQIFGTSLLERAGIQRRKTGDAKKPAPADPSRRYDLKSDAPARRTNLDD
jgi:adenylate cyclase